MMRATTILLLCMLPAIVEAQYKLYEKGHDNYTAGKYAAAIANFSEYLTKGTRDKALDPEVFYLRALSYYKTNDFTNCIPDFEETVLRDHPNRGNIYWFMAKAHDKLGDNTEALNAYNAAVRTLEAENDSKAKLMYDRGMLHLKMNQPELAYADLKQGWALHPQNADINREIAKLEKQGIAAKVAASKNASATQNQPAVTQQADTRQGTKGKTTPANNAPATGTTAVTTAGAKNQPKPEASTPSKSDGAAAQPAQSVASAPAPLSPAQAIAEYYKDEKRYALVIGNGEYPKAIGSLRNPVNDATDFARELQASNFEVQLLINATYGQMRAAMLKFKEKVDAGDRDKTVSLFYYAGHGLQREQENYLVPIDAMVEYEDDIVRYCFPVQRMVLANMERSNSRMNIVILDACRNNPFPSLTRSMGDQGLGEMSRARGSFIAYATAPGSVASDGDGRNGLYTQELVKAVRKPGLTIEQVFKEVRMNVLRLSANKQNTWDSSNIIGEFYFKMPQ